MNQNALEIGRDRLTIENLAAAAKKQIKVRLCNSAEFRAKIKSGADFLDEVLEKHGGIYGVTTGYGDSCAEQVSSENYNELPVNLTRFHGCGMGDYFDTQIVRALMIVRLNTLAQGYSGVSMELMEFMAFFIENNILPLVPQEGSVGASGDLTPLSYFAGALIGERQVMYMEQERSSADVLAELGRKSYQFRPKEAIAIMNGTAVMNAVAAFAFHDAEYLANLACRITAMNSIALKGNAEHFNKRLFELKPYPGQAFAAERIRICLPAERQGLQIVPARIQDNYSIRCAPHVIGLFFDISDALRNFIETEMNSANDNPLIDSERRSVYHGGHFYGGHICFAMDSLKNIIANIADLMDRQLALLVDEKYNRGLPPNLTGNRDNISCNHGFKAVQIAVSAWTAEALKNTMPMSVFSRSTECHNQDKVSMGTIAARECARVNKLTAQVMAASMLAAYQAINLRLKKGELKYDDLGKTKETFEEISAFFKPLENDRPLEADLRKTLELIEKKHFCL
ncbi:MAG: aromatic amino acid ammonia-lyase [Spirochaetes bacterium]|nr:aromatic amino acid ammonia-lyase [Brevinematales bacterium]MCL1959209.1 aromatic amino acid ammonia-lyase [Spirochaetota bacterium]